MWKYEITLIEEVYLLLDNQGMNEKIYNWSDNILRIYKAKNMEEN